MIPVIAGQAAIFLLHAEFTTGDPEMYQLPLAPRYREAGKQAAEKYPDFAVAQVQAGATAPDFSTTRLPTRRSVQSLLEAFAKRKRLRGECGSVAAQRYQLFRTFGRARIPISILRCCLRKSILRSNSATASFLSCFAMSSRAFTPASRWDGG